LGRGAGGSEVDDGKTKAITAKRCHVHTATGAIAAVFERVCLVGKGRGMENAKKSNPAPKPRGDVVVGEN
jgi:hypothetical protein